MMQAAAALVVYAGLVGATGVALAAAGAHGTALSDLTPPAQLLMIHAAAALAVIAVAMRAAHASGFLVAALILLIGASLFSGAVTARVLWGVRLFPMAAPTGGTTMILGWLVLAAAGLWEVLAHRG
ncbi:DUF423 domain-containing protein [Hyphomicrobium sp.]|uniref:DUF423 domain-containing protein n=1 Tax=Hyphomicrobium sp. TaxID=82 RepID=UPI0022CBB6D3|nr:DUF423 domain-containing protein [Hyphomicrobium sp.]MCZ7595942.1 DUF423 domain-containing protein [Hyphomicrobium sp.]